ncbi:MAG: thioredoxin family protein [Candidatus Aenigmarchaeota archaeon]|nr:thioredoxin family protein [Candidatus Aenigmarchaeota archaeon]
MKKSRKKLGPEVIVFGLIALFVITIAIFASIPQQEKSSLPNLGKAPEIAGIKTWINSEPLTIENLKGKVVLADFWTYSCINCIRTLPYLKDWHGKYKDKGLVIIGIHTPEFEFEKDYNNVRNAVEKYELKYAVAMDNDYATWRAYKNSYWPRKYIIDKEGNIRYDHIGEGAYEETEKVIQELLQEPASSTTNLSSGTDFSQIGTPELYLGYAFARAPLGNEEGFSTGNVVDYKYKEPVQGNTIYLSGEWKNEADRIISVNNSKIFLKYKAKNVNIVAGGESKISTLLDGKPLSENAFGKDTVKEDQSAISNISSHRLYNIVSTPDYGTHLLEIDASPGFELYTFTFG